MKNLVTKRNIAIFALTAVLVGWGVNKFGYINYSTAHAIIDPALALLAILFSLYFLRDEIFRSWLKFIAWWLPLGSLLWFVDSSGSGGWVDIQMIPRLLTTSTLVLMSFFLILIRNWELDRADGGVTVAWWIKWTMLIVAFTSSFLSVYVYGLI